MRRPWRDGRAARAGTCAARGLLLCLAASAAASTAAAAAEGPAVASVRPAVGGDLLVADFLLTGLFPPPIENTLRSGLPVVIDLVWELEPERGTAFGDLLRSEVRYDVWEDRYTLLRGAERRDFAAFEAMRLAARRLQGQPLARIARLDGSASFRLSVHVAVSPISGEQRERMARWLSETVSDPQDPSARELRLDLGGLIRNVFRGGRGGETAGAQRFGPFPLAGLPAAASAAADPAAPADAGEDPTPDRGEEP
jgi:hypothetical protein